MSGDNPAQKQRWIEDFNTPWMVFGAQLDIDVVERHGAFVMCQVDNVKVEVILLEFEEPGMAAKFECDLELGARIFVKEDYTLMQHQRRFRNWPYS